MTTKTGKRKILKGLERIANLVVWVDKELLKSGIRFYLQNTMWGQEWWLTPIIPALWEAKEGRSPELSSSRSAWVTWQNPVSTKNTKISWAWWHMPIIPATWEAETKESLEPGRQKLQ